MGRALHRRGRDVLSAVEAARRRPPPAGVSPQKKSVAVSLKAGVHYTVRLEYDNPTGDTTIRLLWASARQAQAGDSRSSRCTPKARSRPARAPDLNVTYFATTTVNNKVKTDLTAPAVAAGSVADLSLTPPIGPDGTPVIELLATPVDASSGKPSPPTVERPHYGGEVFVDGTHACTSQAMAASGRAGFASSAVPPGTWSRRSTEAGTSTRPFQSHSGRKR